MTTHLRVIVWALQVLWGLKTIWFSDRLRLWRKSINLYSSFLVFTDRGRPRDQLHRAMICAVISAVYDYDSDWPYGDRTGTHFLALLEQLVDSPEARQIATDLYRIDECGQLSEDGLERGSVALCFYRLVIDSCWMRDYSDEEIDAFGRKLQIIDDLLDLEGDRVAGNTNCLLLPARAPAFVREATEFLDSPFFLKLKEYSRIYRVIERKTREALLRFGNDRVTAKQLFQAGRPTTGAYAFVLTLISFGFYPETAWVLRLLTAAAFAGLTMSIMVFNDFADREHDRKKGKDLAARHPRELLRYWWCLSGVTAIVLAGVVGTDWQVAGFCLAVWLVGLGYSLAPGWYLVNNIIVAACSAAPALCGVVHAGKFTHPAVATFFLLFLLILWNEIYKDTEDLEIDRGYKNTLPVRLGHLPTFGRLIGWLVLPAAAFVLHPNPWVQRLAFVAMPLLAFEQSAVFGHRQLVARAKTVMRTTLQALLIVLLLT